MRSVTKNHLRCVYFKKDFTGHTCKAFNQTALFWKVSHNMQNPYTCAFVRILNQHLHVKQGGIVKDK